MGHPSTPRHRADVPRALRLVHLRRDLARLLAGHDLDADDQVHRPGVHDARRTADGTEVWPAAAAPAARRAQTA